MSRYNRKHKKCAKRYSQHCCNQLIVLFECGLELPPILEIRVFCHVIKLHITISWFNSYWLVTMQHMKGWRTSWVDGHWQRQATKIRYKRRFCPTCDVVLVRILIAGLALPSADVGLILHVRRPFWAGGLARWCRGGGEEAVPRVPCQIPSLA